MNNRGVRNLFVFGSLFFFAIFVGLTFDTMKKVDERTPEVTETIDQGKQLWHKYDCIGCHTIFGNGSYFGPDLTKVTTNKPAGYLVKFLVNPRAINKTAAMPVLGITDDEAGKIVAFLDWASKVDTNGWPPEPILVARARQAQASPGAALYEQNGCNACHIIRGVGGTAGPDLTHTGAKHPDPDWHRRHLVNPASVVPNSPMPAFGHLGEADLDLLANYLAELK